MPNKTAEELALFIDYAVRREEIALAKAFLAEHKDDQQAMPLISEFYTNLLEVSDEALLAIKPLQERRGLALFVLQTASRHYLAISDGAEARILGEYQVEELPAELLAHFGFKDNAAFVADCPKTTKLSDLRSFTREGRCPVCGVGESEPHILGCPVEICPWCDGQLIHCNCRFELMGVDEIEDEARLQAFEDILEAKGRIPFSREQSPAYPSAGHDSQG
ncbi:MAG: hypothetical protein LBU39_04575 [Desulfobulbaceae bacterium]|jgi:hypothetical protein|nr:hypothetical protein [Desulfobulbaceae bacterium]